MGGRHLPRVHALRMGCAGALPRRHSTGSASSASSLARQPASNGCAWRICLMRTHYHLILSVEDGVLPRGMHALNFRYACAFNQRHDSRGHVQAARYGSRRIEDDDALMYAFRYVARNPVEAGLCADPADWPWSSYAATIGKAEPIPSSTRAASSTVSAIRLRGPSPRCATTSSEAGTRDGSVTGPGPGRVPPLRLPNVRKKSYIPERWPVRELGTGQLEAARDERVDQRLRCRAGLRRRRPARRGRAGTAARAWRRPAHPHRRSPPRARALRHRARRGARPRQGHDRAPREGAREGRPDPRRAHAEGARAHRALLRPHRAALHLQGSDEADGEAVRNVAAASLRSAAEEILPGDFDDRTTFAVLRKRLSDADAKRFTRRLERLQRDILETKDDPNGAPYGLAIALYRRAPDA